MISALPIIPFSPRTEAGITLIANIDAASSQKSVRIHCFTDLRVKITQLVCSFFSQLASFFKQLVACFYTKNEKIESVILYPSQVEIWNAEQIQLTGTGLEKRVTVTDSTGCKSNLANNLQITLDATSSITFNPKINKYTYISLAPPITNLVISGGGAKGVILPGVIKAFEDHRTESGSFREQLENIAGSSIGAITGCLIAAGMSADHLAKATQQVEFKDLLGTGIGPIRKDGKPIMDFLQKYIKQSICENLKQIFKITDLNLINPEMVKKCLDDPARSCAGLCIDQLMTVVNELQKDDNEARITFAMLQTLHILEPKVFKNLTVTATCCETGTVFYFDAVTTPNLDIALACRASASIPIILTYVSIERQFLSPGYADVLPNKSVLTFTDGGYGDNIPVIAMHNKQDDIRNKGEEGQNLKTLVLVFDQSGRSYDIQSLFFDVQVKKYALYDPTSLKNRSRNIIAQLFTSINTQEHHSVLKERGLEEIRQRYTQRNIPLLISLRSIDFEKAKRFEEKFRMNGYNQGREYLTLHQDELIARSFDDLDELLKYVPDDIKQKNAASILEFKNSKKCADVSVLT